MNFYKAFRITTIAMGVVRMALDVLSIYFLSMVGNPTSVFIAIMVAMRFVIMGLLIPRLMANPGFPFRRATAAETDEINNDFWGGSVMRRLGKLLLNASSAVVIYYMIFVATGLAPLGYWLLATFLFYRGADLAAWVAGTSASEWLEKGV